MGFLATVLEGYAGYQRGRDNAYQRGLEQQKSQQAQEQIDIERQRAADEATYQHGELAAQGLGPDGKVAPLPVVPGAKVVPPPVGAKGAAPTSEQWLSYYEQQSAQVLAAYQATGDPRLLQELNALSTAAQKYTMGGLNIDKGQDITQGDIPLKQAQAKLALAKTDYTRSWKQRLQMQLSAVMQRVGAQQAGAMQRAQASAASRLSASRYSTDARAAIAMQTALNVASRQDEGQAFQAAKAEYDQAMKTYDQQLGAYNRGELTAPPVQPQASQYFTIGAPAAPSVSVQVYTAPDGRKVSVPVVKPGGAVNAGSRLPDPSPLVAQDRKAGHSDQQIAASMKRAGYDEATIRRVLGTPRAAPNTTPIAGLQFKVPGL